MRDVRLKASLDKVSGLGLFPPIPDKSPAAFGFDPIEMGAQATLYSFTIIHPNPKTGQAPFVLIYADFPEKVRVFGRLVLPEGVPPKIGMPLRVVAPAMARDGEDQSNSYFFIPAGK